jgi:hypothetical protein
MECYTPCNNSKKKNEKREMLPFHLYQNLYSVINSYYPELFNSGKLHLLHLLSNKVRNAFIRSTQKPINTHGTQERFALLAKGAE